MLWLVFALPAAAIGGTLWMVSIAGGPGSTDAVAEPVRRTAQVQVADLGPDARAQQLRLSAIVRSEDGVLEVLPVGGEFDRGAALQLRLHHPAREDLDRAVQLAPTELGWRAEETLDAGNAWNVELAPTDGRWRLQGRLPKGQHAAYLEPTVGPAP
jgi:hypothetical protein